jgi:flagellar hook-length control protein FliK
MFVQQMQLPVKQGESIKSEETDQNHALFQSLLDGSLTGEMLPDQQEGEENEKGANPLSYSLQMLVDHIPADEEWSIEMTEIADLEVQEQMDLPSDDASNILSAEKELEQSELQAAYQSLINIFPKVQETLAQLNKEPENTGKIAPKLLELLQQWVKSANNADQKGIEKALTSFRQEDTKANAIWKDLLQAFEKRHQLASKQQYRTNAAVTAEDISRWLGKTAEHQMTDPDRLAVQRMHTSSHVPISRMEQYVVYINQNQNVQAQGQQLTDQFQTIIKSSNFLTAPNNGNQLVLSLRPENLGEMMIRFTQINGEMTVKILVTTQAAKEMLETNMHQLRNIFSPQQVVVEKQDIQTQQGQDTEKSLKDDQLEEQEHQQSNESSEDEKETSGDDFQAKFEALLMNEEV